MKNIHERLSRIFQELKNIVDDSIIIRKKSKEHKLKIAKIYENFLRELFAYIKQKGKETGENLLWGISLFRIRK